MSVRLRHCVLLVFVCVFAFFVNNSVIYTDIMESRNLVTAREMVYDGHWMIPTMNGDLRLEKPPLPTWIAAGAEMLSPDDIALQRAMAGVAATMLVVFFWLLGREITRSPRFAVVSTLVLCTSYNIILMGRTASWDIYCHAFMLGAIYFLWCSLTREGRQWGRFFCAGLFLGLSFMSKGPVSFYALLLPFLLSYLVFQRHRMRGKWCPLLLAVVVCVAVSGWWYVYVYLFHSQEAQYVLGKESGSWVNRNVRPWWYYSTFFLETGVWALLTLTALLFPYWQRRVGAKQSSAYLFAFFWMVALVVLLSFLPEKKNRYLLPVLIPAAYSVGFVICTWARMFEQRERCRSARWLWLVNASLVSLVVVALPVAAWVALYEKGTINMGEMALVAAVSWVVAIILIYATMRLKPLLFVGGVTLLFMAAETLFMPFVGYMVNNADYHSIRLSRQEKALDGLPFYYVEGDPLRIELVYEAGRKIRPLNVADRSSVEQALPCAILTHGRVGEELPRALWRGVDTVWVARYDNNRRPKGTSRYKRDFIYNVTILKKK